MAGVRHLVAAPSYDRARLAQQLGELLGPLARAAGLVPTMHELNLGDSATEFRVPDGGLHRPGAAGVWLCTAALVVEICSPDDETWQKLPFYAAHDAGRGEREHDDTERRQRVEPRGRRAKHALTEPPIASTPNATQLSRWPDRKRSAVAIAREPALELVAGVPRATGAGTRRALSRRSAGMRPSASASSSRRAFRVGR